MRVCLWVCGYGSECVYVCMGGCMVRVCMCMCAYFVCTVCMCLFVQCTYPKERSGKCDN